MNKFNITAKTNFYYSNGTGRDTYILENSGGMTHTRRPQSAANESSRYMTFAMRKHVPLYTGAKVVHYPSDGSGRDNYIISNSGGLMSKTHTNTNASNLFREVLRNYAKQEKLGLYSINFEEMRMLKQRQLLKSANLSQPRRTVVPFHKLLEISKEKEFSSHKHI